ncbi:unnamed protein product [Hyaloperonospora brassicae]|uniref:GPI-anchored surface protein n=1 Tax=Hyaloperonospora brassicae TaxID=162125 RepID=A0AAV0TYH5_HYABA|nr:unnamed protein product [Hyaloperonospora brassicae]
MTCCYCSVVASWLRCLVLCGGGRPSNNTRWSRFRAHDLFFALLVVAAVVTDVAAQDSLGVPTQRTSENSSIAGSQLLTWWGERGDVDHALAQLGGVQSCPEDVNVRVDAEVVDEKMLSFCSQETAGYDIMGLLQPSETLLAPIMEQTSDVCRSEACTAWLSQAANSSWLPECSYRRSQASLRSLAETLLRVCKDLMNADMDNVVVPPTASSFQQLYKLNVLANMVTTKKGVRDEGSSPVLQITRQMAALDESRVVGSDVVLLSGAAGERPMSVSILGNANRTGTLARSRSASGFDAARNSSNFAIPNGSSDWNSLRNTSFGVASSWNDSADFTSSAAGPHASSTTTTTDLRLSYACVVGAWVLFNGSYYFLMRRK